MRTLLPIKNQAGAYIFVALMSLLLLTMTACGYRGPLYLPEEPAPETPSESSDEQAIPVETDDSTEVESDEEERESPP
jgi:predicted small lipoprotein YifL